jgi:hypothetical protein
VAKPSTDDLLKEAHEAFGLCEERERENREAALDDIRFARLEEQWDSEAVRQRMLEGRPCLTINKLAPVIRQVVNDSRQNKPSIKVLPQDSNADPHTAEIYSGLIRNIEASSDADVAYDTAVENAVTGGFGFFRIGLEYACDDNWDQDIVFQPVADPFSVYGDPHSTAADSSDWNLAFVSEMMPKKDFEKRFKGADPVDWAGFDQLPSEWMEGEQVRVAEWWTREQVKRKIVLLTNGEIIPLKEFEAKAQQYLALGVAVQGSPREVMSYKVTQRLITGVDVLETVEWAGKYIPIVPVYGDTVVVQGKRHLRSLIRSAKDAQRNFNYWRSAATEMVALAPRAPWIGKEGTFDADIERWQTSNRQSHAFLEYKGEMPQRVPFDGAPAGMLQEAMNASDDIKSTTGMFDASMGAQSNETSGRAIMARQREGDVSTFHFIDNLSRAIRHGGRILIDLIPKVYGEDRMLRVLGPEGEPTSIKTAGPQNGAPVPPQQDFAGVFDLSAGKYDLTVTAGPSFTTRREEAATQMIELMRAYPAAAPVIGDLLAKNLDWPGADEIAKRLQMLLPPQLQGQSPEAQAAQQQMQMLGQQLEQAMAALNAAQADKSLEAEKLKIDAYNAETNRLKVTAASMTPEAIAPIVLQALQQILASPDVLPAPANDPSAFAPDGL